MSFLLDTNVVSEWAKPIPEPRVVDWLANVNEDSVYLSVVTLAEISHGIVRLPQGARRRRLEVWLNEDLSVRFEGRVLPVDSEIALLWGAVTAQAERGGKALAAMDGLIAATALVRGYALVTRDARGFQDLGMTVVNPWDA